MVIAERAARLLHLAVLSSCCLPLSAQPVEEAGSSLPHARVSAAERSPVDDILPPDTPLRFSLQLEVGMFRPAGDEVQVVYGDQALRYGLAIGYHVLPSVVASLGVAYQNQSGTAVGATSQEASQESAELTTVPIDLSASYQFNHFPVPMLVPVVTIGLDCVPYREEVADEVISGGKWGAHARGGLLVRVDSGPMPSWTSDSRSGIRRTSILVEAGYGFLNNFGRAGLDLSGLSLMGGVSLEF